MRRKWLLVLVGMVALAACKRVDEEEAKGAVMRYLDKLAQAYRASDEEIVDPFVTERLGRKLTGLIGVKRDVNLVLDSTLLGIEFERFARDGDAIVVDTHERWHYRDVQIGTGAQAGEASTDEYRMRYRLVRQAGQLKVDETAFRAEPVVGRKSAPMAIPTRKAHGLPPVGGALGDGEDPSPRAEVSPPQAEAR